MAQAYDLCSMDYTHECTYRAGMMVNVPSRAVVVHVLGGGVRGVRQSFRGKRSNVRVGKSHDLALVQGSWELGCVHRGNTNRAPS